MSLQSRGQLLGRLAPVTLMPLAALAVHDLRYLLAYRGSAGLELARQGHAYLHSLVPWIAALTALAAGLFARALGRAFRGHTSRLRYTTSLVVLWALCAGSLLAVYVVQEALEGIFAGGHPAGVTGILGFGGWWAIPLAVAIGLVLAVFFHGARWLIDAVADRRRGAPAARRAPAITGIAQLVWLHCPEPVIDGCSRRGPPARPWF